MLGHLLALPRHKLATIASGRNKVAPGSVQTRPNGRHMVLNYGAKDEFDIMQNLTAFWPWGPRLNLPQGALTMLRIVRPAVT